MYNFESLEQLKKAPLLSETPSYHDWTSTCGTWRFIALNSFEICTMSHNVDSRNLAWKIIVQHNPNTNGKDAMLPNCDWLTGLTGKERRFNPFNGYIHIVFYPCNFTQRIHVYKCFNFAFTTVGAISDTQLQWLKVRKTSDIVFFYCVYRHSFFT